MYPEITPSRVAGILRVLAVTGRALFLIGASGIGKSDIGNSMGMDAQLKKIAWGQWSSETGNPVPPGDCLPDLEVIHLTLPQHEAEDFLGVPFHRILEGKGEERVTCWAPAEALRKNVPVILFLDEVNAAELRVQKVLLQIVNERKIASIPLSPGTVIVMAGNRAEDRASVKSMPFTLGNRSAIATMVVSDEDWLQWAETHGIPAIFRAYVRMRGVKALHNYDSQNPSLAQLTPRSYVAAALAYDEACRQGLDELDKEDLIKMNIGEADGTDLCTYLKYHEEMPSWQEILGDSNQASLPGKDISKIYYLSAFLIDRLCRDAKPDQVAMAAGMRYLERMIESNPDAMDAASMVMDALLPAQPETRGRGKDGYQEMVVTELRRRSYLSKSIRAFMDHVAAAGVR